MHTPKVSVLLSIYKTAPWLPAALDSVLSQTLSDLEVICVDDGSPDNSIEIMNAYAAADSRVRVLRQENSGQSAARNKAAAEAIGEWLYFMDSDDTLEPTALQELYERGVSDDLQMVFMDTRVFPDTPEWEKQAKEDYNGYYRVLHEYPDIYNGPDYLRRVKENDEFIAPAWTFLIRRDFVEEHDLHFRVGIQREDDLFEIHALFRAQRVAHLHRMLVNHRIRGGSVMTVRPTLQYAWSDMLVADEICSLLTEIPVPDDVYREVVRHAKYMESRALQDYFRTTEEERAKLSTLPLPIRTMFEIRILAFENHQSSHILSSLQPETDDGLAEGVYMEYVTTEEIERRRILQKEATYLFNEYNRIQTTLSYRMGRVQTWLPRWIRDTWKAHHPDKYPEFAKDKADKKSDQEKDPQ